MPLINCEIILVLTWSENCVLIHIITQAANPNADPAIPAINAPTDTTFKINDAKLHVPVVTLSTQDYLSNHLQKKDDRTSFFKVLYNKSWNKRFQFINWWKKFFLTSQ